MACGRDRACVRKNPFFHAVGAACAAQLADHGFVIESCCGCGLAGCSFKTVRGGLIVKITDEGEAVIALEIARMARPHPMFYKVAKLRSGKPAVGQLRACRDGVKAPAAMRDENAVWAIVREDVYQKVPFSNAGKFNFATARLESIARDVVIDGKDMKSILERQEPLLRKSVAPKDIQYLEQMLGFFRYTMSRGVMLRDLIADNLGLRAGTDQIVVRDIGAARVYKSVPMNVRKTQARPAVVLGDIGRLGGGPSPAVALGVAALGAAAWAFSKRGA